MRTWLQRVFGVRSERPASASVEQSGGPPLSQYERTGEEASQDPEFAARDRMDYETSVALFTELVRTRFQLLGLLPLTSGAVIALLERFSAGPKVLIGPALLGLLVTAGLVVYEIRNSQIHDNVVHRLRHLERILGLSPATPDRKARAGFFSERSTRQIYLRPVTSDLSSSDKPNSGARLKVRHDAGLSVVYGAVIAAWAAFLTWNVESAWPTTLRSLFGVRQQNLPPGIVTVVAAVAAGLLGWRIVSATSLMGRNVTRVYRLEPLELELLKPSDDQTAHLSERDVSRTLISRLLQLDVPTKPLGEKSYSDFRDGPDKEVIRFWESLGGLQHRRALSLFCVRNSIQRNDDIKLLIHRLPRSWGSLKFS